MTFAPGERHIGEYLLSARSFAEYRAMFSITNADLRTRILDCPGGGASFTAMACAAGAHAVAVDPVYAATPAEVAGRVAAEVDRGSAWTMAHADRYVWDFYGDRDGHDRMRAESARLFAADMLAHPDRYRRGALPQLPFDDDSFDLVLSSHLLFTYSDRLDREFHRAALLEMTRVSREEVRVFPLVNYAGHHESLLVESLTVDLAEVGVHVSLRGVNYEFQRGANTMLVLHAAVGGLGTRKPSQASVVYRQ